MNGPLEWIAAIGTMLAAGLIAADLGRKVTGWGFVLVCAVSVTWIVSGLTGGALPIAAMNAILLAINAWGVWQFLLSPKNKARLEKMEELADEVEREVEAPPSPNPLPRRGEGFAGLPDAHTLVGRQVELVAFLDAERIVPCVEVAHSQRAEVARSVAVGGDALAKLGVAELARPSLGVGDEEPLVAGEAVDHRSLLA